MQLVASGQAGIAGLVCWRAPGLVALFNAAAVIRQLFAQQVQQF